MSFPLPPLNNRVRDNVEMPVAEKPKDNPSARLTDNETEGILRDCLRPDQMDDEKVIRFILSYLECRNAAQAAREAGTPGKGAYLRGRPEIHTAIEKLTAKAVLKFGYDATEVIERVKEIAALDPIEFENPDGSFKTHMSQIDPASRRAIKKFRAKNLYGKDANNMNVVIGQLIEVELWDKLKASELLGREKSIFKETKKVEHDVTTNMASLLLDSQRRADQRLLTSPAEKDVIEIEVKREDEDEAE